MKTLVKFCGMMRREDIFAAAATGVDFLGFVLVPGSRRFLNRTALPELLAAVPPDVKTVFVVENLPLPEIARLIADFHPDIIQLHGHETPEYARNIQQAEVWKAVHLITCQDIEKFAGFPAEFLIADAGQGGSGQCCDWTLTAKLAARRKILLAGGISPENALQAIEVSQAAGIDVASGIELAPGIKDPGKMQQLMNAVRSSVNR